MESLDRLNFQPVMTETENILNSVIWGNSLIRRENRPIFHPKLITSNIDKILDIYDVEKAEFIPYYIVQENYGNVIDELLYLSIKAAIPNMWKIQLRQERLKSEIDITPEIENLANKQQTRKPFGFMQSCFFCRRMKKMLYFLSIEILFIKRNT